MAPEALSRKQQILEAAARILRTKSFSAFSYQDLADALEIRKASLHHHFRTKQDLALALIEHVEGNARRALASLAEGGASAGEQLRRFLAAAEHTFGEGEGDVCCMRVLAVDAEDLAPETVARLASMGEGMHAHLAGLIAAAQRAGEVTAEGPPEALALMLIATIQGVRAISLPGQRLYPSVIAQLERTLGLA